MKCEELMKGIEKETIIKDKFIKTAPKTMKHKYHTGIKFFYRKYLAMPLARFLYKRFGVFNPNIITLSGFFIYAICSFLFILYKNPFLFVFGIQFNLIIDYVDGSYARITNQATRFGEILDNLLDNVVLFSLFGVLFFTTSPLLIFILILIYSIDGRFKSFRAKINKEVSIEESKKVEEDNFLKNLLKSPFGFTFSHIYLYLSLWVIFNNVYILMALILMGLLSLFKTVLSFFRK